MPLVSSLVYSHSRHSAEKRVVLKITSVCIKLFIQRSLPASSGVVGVSLEIPPPCYGQYKGWHTYTICCSISFLKVHTGFVYCMQKKMLEHFRETQEKCIGFSVVSWTLQQISVLFFLIFTLKYILTWLSCNQISLVCREIKKNSALSCTVSSCCVKLFHNLVTFAPPSPVMFGNIKECPLCALAFYAQ